MWNQSNSFDGASFIKWRFTQRQEYGLQRPSKNNCDRYISAKGYTKISQTLMIPWSTVKSIISGMHSNINNQYQRYCTHLARWLGGKKKAISQRTHMVSCLKFAQRHLKYPAKNWQKVLWSKGAKVLFGMKANLAHQQNNTIQNCEAWWLKHNVGIFLICRDLGTCQC